ncbi:MAG: polyprenyl synthetase family protein [Ignavibacteriaceae bacterium]
MSAKINADNDWINSLYERERVKIESRIQSSVRGRKPESLYKPASYILESGGKRLRPLLVLLSARAVNGKFSQAYNAAVAVELLHNFTLVHDDIMDNADKRRNRATLHKKYDTSTAILFKPSKL